MAKDIELLRKKVRSRLSYKRYAHTLSVEKAALSLAEIFMPERKEEISIAALLHDITKELTYEEHVELINDSGLLLTDEDLSISPSLHSISAFSVITRDFLEYSNKDILSSVYNHTLGDDDMSLFDKIVFFADYIEDSRPYESSKRIREYFYENIVDKSPEKQIAVLDDAIRMCLEATFEHLNKIGRPIHSRSLRFYESLK